MLKGILPISIPNPIGISSIGSNSLATAKYMKNKPTRIITTWPTVALAKPVYVQKSARLFPINVINSPILFNNYKVITFENGISFTYVDRSDFTVFVGIDIVLHLHSFEDNDGLSSLHCITYIDFDVEDNTRQR